jgi:hypothetical protein
LIQYFNTVKGYFNYEEFYDFFNYDAIGDPDVELYFHGKCYGYERDLSELISSINNIYTQLVDHFLVDSNGESWYDNVAYRCGPYWTGYTGILDVLQTMARDHIVNIHTLNHDLFFESLNNSVWLQGELCDGFEELGSPYYGKLLVEGRRFKCRLQFYTGKYIKKFRLYKLHGSKDYGLYYCKKCSVSTPEKYVKTRWGIGFNELYKETEDTEGNLVYERCLLNYHADFLTGTTSKIERYQEPLLFQTLFEHFRSNLLASSQLIIVGYGGRDKEINKMLLEYYDHEKKPCFIIDPFPGPDIRILKDKLSAKLIEKHLENILISDLE